MDDSGTVRVAPFESRTVTVPRSGRPAAAVPEMMPPAACCVPVPVPVSGLPPCAAGWPVAGKELPPPPPQPASASAITTAEAMPELWKSRGDGRTK